MPNIIISKLIDYFEKLPGIGPRQARRFVYYLLSTEDIFIKNFSQAILNLKKEISQCIKCHKFFENTSGKNECEICLNLTRRKDLLLIIEKDIDLENIEKAGFFNGVYFVLGGLIPALGTKIPKEIKMKELFNRIKNEAKTNDLKEIIIALNATLEGDNTARYIEKILEPILEKSKIKISRLGRGLSTGTELEYSDKDTIIYALKNRQ